MCLWPYFWVASVLGFWVATLPNPAVHRPPGNFSFQFLPSQASAASLAERPGRRASSRPFDGGISVGMRTLPRQVMQLLCYHTWRREVQFTAARASLLIWVTRNRDGRDLYPLLSAHEAASLGGGTHPSTSHVNLTYGKLHTKVGRRPASQYYEPAGFRLRK